MRRVNFYIGLFLITAAILMFQIMETRILSVITWYYLSFFIISIAMFGLTLGAVWIYLRGDRFTEATLSRDLAYFSAAFAVSAVCWPSVETVASFTSADLETCIVT